MANEVSAQSDGLSPELAGRVLLEHRVLWAANDEVVTDLCALAEDLQITPREQFDGDAVSQKLYDIAKKLEAAQP